nr:hypothetical protein [Tanacetum cinerariifolium]
SVQTDEPSRSGTTIVEVLKELPKVSMRDNVSSSESAPTFVELFETNELKAQIQKKDTVILKLKEKIKSSSGDVKERKSVEVADLNASLQEKVLVITALKEQLKGKAVLPKVVSLNPIDPAVLQVDVVPLVPKLCKNGTAYIDYIKHTLEEAATLRELVESERLLKKIKSSSGDVKERKVERKVEEIETQNLELDHKVTKLIAANEHLKQTYTQLFDSIKSSRVQSKEQCDDLINKVNLKSVEVVDLNASLQEKLLVDVVPLVPKLRKNRIAHIDYIRHTQEEAATLKELVETKRHLSPLNRSLAYACKYTRQIQELLMILQQTCPRITDLGTNLVAVTPKNKTKQIRRTAQIIKSEKTSVATSPSPNIDSNTPVLSSTGVTLVSSASGLQSQDNTKKNRI